MSIPIILLRTNESALESLIGNKLSKIKIFAIKDSEKMLKEFHKVKKFLKFGNFKRFDAKLIVLIRFIKIYEHVVKAVAIHYSSTINASIGLKEAITIIEKSICANKSDFNRINAFRMNRNKLFHHLGFQIKSSNIKSEIKSTMEALNNLAKQITK